MKGLPIRLDNSGESTRDFIYVDDIVRGLRLCAQKGEPGEVYNLASGTETSIRTLAELILSQVSVPVPLEIAPRRDWDHSGRRFGSTEKAHHQLGFEAMVDLAVGVAGTVQWTRDHLREIEASIDRHAREMANLSAA